METISKESIKNMKNTTKKTSLTKERVRQVQRLSKAKYRIQDFANGLKKAAENPNTVIDDEGREQLLKIRDRFKIYEAELDKDVKPMVLAHPMWDHFFKNVKGIGPTLAGVLIGYIDIYRADCASKICSLCGMAIDRGWIVNYSFPGEKPKTKEFWVPNPANILSVIPPKKRQKKEKDEDDGRKKGGRPQDSMIFATVHSIVPLIDKETGKQAIFRQRRRTGQLTSYINFLKSKVLNTIPGSFMKAGNEKYVGLYISHKHEFMAKKPESRKKHWHLLAVREMMKVFIWDMYKAWRELEGLEVRSPYAEEYIGKIHPFAIPSRLNPSEIEDSMEGFDNVEVEEEYEDLEDIQVAEEDTE